MKNKQNNQSVRKNMIQKFFHNNNIIKLVFEIKRKIFVIFHNY